MRNSTLKILPGEWSVQSERVVFRTSSCMEFLDITEAIAGFVASCGIHSGILNVQSLHTTAALVVNENEPLLLQDMRQMLERLAPQNVYYGHNDFRIRIVNMTEEEDQNGHSHCKALFLPTSQMLNIVDGNLRLGKWQRIFLLELDSARERTVSVVAIGLPFGN